VSEATFELWLSGELQSRAAAVPLRTPNPADARYARERRAAHRWIAVAGRSVVAAALAVVALLVGVTHSVSPATWGAQLASAVQACRHDADLQQPLACAGEFFVRQDRRPAPAVSPPPPVTPTPTGESTPTPTPVPSATPSPLTPSATVSSGGTVLLSDQFTADPAGAPAHGWVGSKDFVVVHDGTASYVHHSGTSLGMMLAGQTGWSHYTLSASVRVSAGSAGVAIARGTSLVYACRLGEGRLTLILMSSGKVNQLAAAPAPLDGHTGQWSHLEISAGDGVVRCSTGNGAHISSGVAGSITGMAGLIADGISDFDDVLARAGTATTSRP
jgi:hypothetical protein